MQGGRVGLSFTRGAIHIVSGPYTPLDIDPARPRRSQSTPARPVLGNAEWMLLVNGSLSRMCSFSDQTQIRVTGDQTNLETGGVTLATT